MAADPNRLAGIAYLTINGVSYMIAGDAKYSPSTVKRETLTGQSGVDGYSEMPVAGFISMSVRDSANFKVADFNAMRDVTVVLELASGKTVTGGNMWCTEAQEVDTTDAKFEVRFDGRNVVEV
jgi:hypothetical protein